MGNKNTKKQETMWVTEPKKPKTTSTVQKEPFKQIETTEQNINVLNGTRGKTIEFLENVLNDE